MRRDFGLEIPVFDEDDTPGSYFAKFDEILEIKKRWSIRSHMSLALLSFGKLLMYRDLDPKNWPAGESIAKHDLVRELFEGTKSTEVERGEEYAIDAPELKEIVPHLIRDADSSQQSALIHALRGPEPCHRGATRNRQVADDHEPHRGGTRKGEECPVRRGKTSRS